VTKLGANRIGHGIRSIEDQEIVELLAEREIVLEVCPTSNLHSGVVVDLDEHPIAKLYAADVHTTINTDDPLISNISLTTELLDTMFNMRFTLDDVKQQILYAAKGAFLPEDERKALVKRFEDWFAPKDDA
jgi:adenosine deaminase